MQLLSSKGFLQLVLITLIFFLYPILRLLYFTRLCETLGRKRNNVLLIGIYMDLLTKKKKKLVLGGGWILFALRQFVLERSVTICI